MLITIFATSRSTGVYAINIVTTGKGFYHRTIHPAAAYLLALSTQMLGHGWAGIFSIFLVDSPYLCRCLYSGNIKEKEKGIKEETLGCNYFS